MERARTLALAGRIAERGAAIVEAAIALPILIVVVLGAIQFGLAYEAKAALNHASLQAARSGAVANANPDAIREGLARGLTPLYSPRSSLQGFADARARVESDIRSNARVQILNPSREAFADFAERLNGVPEIPNDRLHARSTAAGPRSGLNIQDANLLRIRVTYGLELKVPLIDGFLPRVLLAFRPTDPFERELLRRSRLPITSTATVRMQSPARESGLVVARADLPDVERAPVTAAPGAESSPTATQQEQPSGSAGGSSSGDDGSSLGEGFFGFGEAGSGDDPEESAPESGEPGSEGNVADDSGATDEVPLCTPSATTNEPIETDRILTRVWTELRNIAGQAYEFVRGFWDGIKNQLTDFVDLITDPLETARGMYELAAAFLEDPSGTASEIARALGRDVAQLAQCGSYDRGRVLGNYVSPAFMVKLASKLAHFGNLRRSLGETVSEFEREMGTEHGCASFVAGTLVLASNGLTPIEHVVRGASIRSRGSDYLDRNRMVAAIFRREVPRYRYVETERDEFNVTEEHPFWVQGRGWVPIKDIELGTPVATLHGDTLVLANHVVDRSIAVFNFSVAETASYFVGREHVWVHNAFCEADAALKYSNVYGTRLPRQGSGGSWSGQRGNSEWQPEPGTPLHEATGGRAIVFREGYPDFEPFVFQLNGQRASVPVEGLLGNTTSDFTKADAAFRALLGDPSWGRPDGYTWHHHQNCRTMLLVPSVLNGRVPHTGGAANVANGEC